MEKENLQQKAEEYLNGWKRAKADLINYKKEEIVRFTEVIKFANEQLIFDILPALDSLDLAEDSGGLGAIKLQLKNILEKNGLEKMENQKDKNFNPAFHEAVESVESDKPPGTILEEVLSGYKFNGKLIRAAQVKVSK